MASRREHSSDDCVYDFSGEPTPDIPERARRCLELLLNSDGLDASPDERAQSTVARSHQESMRYSKFHVLKDTAPMHLPCRLFTRNEGVITAQKVVTKHSL
jgi:hypothetical protein